MNYSDFFEQITEYAPFPYQKRLGEEAFPDLLDIPTGLGKTAAVIIAWLYKRLESPETTPRRLIYCLPMRVLVTQTHDEISKWLAKVAEMFALEHELPQVYMLMGGTTEIEWAAYPEKPAIIVGTQDMLLSRALMRGYAMSRYAWPIHFSLMQTDALWVFDETQLMGVGVETSAQLDA